jgi:Dihydrouridine synthase (Dus)
MRVDYRDSIAPCRVCRPQFSDRYTAASFLSSACKLGASLPATRWPLGPTRMKIGPFTLPNALLVAPMAGVTDRPFRQLCKRLGAGYAVSEMVTSRKDLWNTLKTSRRLDHTGEAPTTSSAARRSSTSTWAARRRKCATAGPDQP